MGCPFPSCQDFWKTQPRIWLGWVNQVCQDLVEYYPAYLGSSLASTCRGRCHYICKVVCDYPAEEDELLVRSGIFFSIGFYMQVSLVLLLMDCLRVSKVVLIFQGLQELLLAPDLTPHVLQKLLKLVILRIPRLPPALFPTSLSVLRLRYRLGGYYPRMVGGLSLTPLSYIYTHILYLVVDSSSNVLSSTRTCTCTQLGSSLVIVISLALFLPIPYIPTLFSWSTARL